jgi:hypothetical protein
MNTIIVFNGVLKQISNECFIISIGQLRIATYFDVLSGSNDKADQTIMQKSRIFRCALSLLSKINLYYQNNELFNENIRKEADELSQSPLTKAILNLIATGMTMHLEPLSYF